VANATTMLEHHFIRVSFLPHWLAVVKNKADQELIFKEIEEQLNDIAVKNQGLTLTIPLACFEAKKIK
jgi:hypothetical protein